MKKSVLYFFLIMLAPSLAVCQSGTTLKKKKTPFQPQNIVTIYPFAFVGNALMLGYERARTERNTFKLNVSLAISEEFNNYYYNVGTRLNPVEISRLFDLTEFQIELQPRFYVMDNAPRGAYIAPFLHYKNMTFKHLIQGSANSTINIPSSLSNDINISALNVGLVLGYQFFTFDKMAFDFYLGGGLMTGFGEASNFRSDLLINQYRRGLAIQVGISLGLGFSQRNAAL